MKLIRNATACSSFRLCLLIAFTLGVASGCGNKGALFIEPDRETLEELEKAKQEINQTSEKPGSTPGSVIDPDDPDGKSRKNKDPQQ